MLGEESAHRFVKSLNKVPRASNTHGVDVSANAVSACIEHGQTSRGARGLTIKRLRAAWASYSLKEPMPLRRGHAASGQQQSASGAQDALSQSPKVSGLGMQRHNERTAGSPRRCSEKSRKARFWALKGLRRESPSGRVCSNKNRPIDQWRTTWDVVQKDARLRAGETLWKG
jgi:hypothetical protein